MRYTKILLTAVFTVCSAGSVLAADMYKIDPVHSSIGFSVRHNMVSNVKGDFKDFSGEIMLDQQNMANSSVMVTIKTASITTANERRDNHLKSPDFFDVESFPEITFKSSRVEKKGDGYVAHGTLTIRGVSKEIALPFTLGGPIKMGNNSRLGTEASLTINRQDYGVSWNRMLDVGGVVVGDDVKIELNVEAVSG